MTLEPREQARRVKHAVARRRRHVCDRERLDAERAVVVAAVEPWEGLEHGGHVGRYDQPPRCPIDL